MTLSIAELFSTMQEDFSFKLCRLNPNNEQKMIKKQIGEDF